MEELGSETCVNCGTPKSGHFCPVCGQPMEVRRINLRSVFHETLEKLFGFDNRFVRTMWHGFTKPGKVAMAYIKGNRSRYIGPVPYFILVTTFYILFTNVTDFDYAAYAMSSIGGDLNVDREDESLKSGLAITLLISKHTRTLYALNALLLAFPIWLFFRKSKKINLLESLAAATYVSAQTILIALISVMLFHFFAISSAIAASVLNFALSGWLVATMFTPKPSLTNFIKGIVAVVISGIIGAFLAAAFILVGALLFEEQFLYWLGLGELVTK